jgi:hypothetical protein
MQQFGLLFLERRNLMVSFFLKFLFPRRVGSFKNCMVKGVTCIPVIFRVVEP